MDSAIFSNFGLALQSLSSISTLMIMILGVFSGLIAGALPGIGGAAALAILFPITYDMPLSLSILFLLAVYTAAEYGGSISAILIRTPGTGAAAATVLDGYPLSQKGFTRKALTISLASGVSGGFISTFIFMCSAPTLAWIGLQFGPIEMFALGVFGLSIVCGLVGKSVVKGFMAAAIGAFLSTVGPSHFSGYRYTFDQPFLMDGIPMVVAFIGFFAVSEALKMLIDKKQEDPLQAEQKDSIKTDFLTFKELKRLYKSIVRGGLIGTFIGIIPGAGAGIASFIAYNEEKRWSKTPEAFGKGIEEGVAAPEASNNAVVGGCLVPTLALGIPGSAAAALIMGLLIMKGITPGPLLFRENVDLVYLIFIGLLIINLFLLGVGYLGLNVFSLVAKVPQRVLGPIIIVIVLTGIYSYQTNPYHPAMAFILGVLGYIFEKVKIPIVPLVLAYIMGPIMEYNFIHALMISRGDLSVIVKSPICVVILALALFSAVFGYIREQRGLKAN